MVSHAYQDGSPDLAVDPDGTTRLSVERDWTTPAVYTDNGILSATDDGAGGDWTTTRVSEACGDDGDGCGIDVAPSSGRDSGGAAHLAWVRGELAGDGNHPGLWHAVEHANGTWTSELVVAAPSGIVGPDLAIGPDDAVHIAYVRYGRRQRGRLRGDERDGLVGGDAVAPLAADAGVGSARVQVSTAGDVDVAWAGPDGVFDATRTGGTWARAGRGVAGPGRRPWTSCATAGRSTSSSAAPTPFGEPDGIEYATSAGGPWSVETLDAGVDASPRLAVDADGHVHVTYLRVSPEPQVRYATDATGTWETEVVTESWTWLDPSFAVDGAGHHHVAVARQGTEPGLWYGTDASGSWSMERLTTIAPDGGVGLVVAPDGSASIAYGESIDGTEAQVAEQTAWLATGTPGAWTFTQLATEATTGTHAIAREADGTLHVAFGINDAGERPDRVRHRRVGLLGRRPDRRQLRADGRRQPVDRRRRRRPRARRVRGGGHVPRPDARSSTRPTPPVRG